MAARIVSFRLGANDYEALEQVASASGMTAGQYARHRALLAARHHAVLHAPFASQPTTTLGPVAINWHLPAA